MRNKELYTNEGYWTTKIQLELYRSLENHMREENLSRTQLARKLGVTKGYISQVLNGDFDHRLSRLVKLSLAIGLVPEMRFKNLKDLISNLENNTKTITWEIDVKEGDSQSPMVIDDSGQPLENVG